MKPSRVLVAMLLLAGCSDAGDHSAGDPSPQASGGNDDLVDCALGGSAKFEHVCAVDQVRDQAGLTLVLRAPDGGFRRLLVTGDGRGVIAADGALPATVTPLGADRIEVAISGDRYRLPANIREPG
jgi:hypothetical protein